MIVLGYLLVDLFCLFWVHLLYELGRYAGVDASRLDDGLAQYDRTGSDDRSFTDHGMVQYDRAHPDQGAVAYLCPVDRDVMTDRHIVADLNRRFFV